MRRALILFIQTLVLYKSFTYLLIYDALSLDYGENGETRLGS